MSKFDFKKYKKGIIEIEIKSLMPEKFINLLWKNNVKIKNVKRKDITTFCFEANLKDYNIINEIAKRVDTKIKIVNRKGISFFIIKTKRRQTLLIGIILFIGIIYYLSNFIWGIDITTEKNISPYEIRNQLRNIGIKPGVNKKNIDVYSIEEKIVTENTDIMWARARVEGAKLNVKVAERQEPPEILVNKSPSHIVANKDGEIIRVYSKAGTVMVKKGDIVKKGHMLIKGEQGIETNTYLVHAEGEVIAKTFYEEKAEVSTVITEKIRTGKVEKEIYLELFGKKIYLKKSKNKFQLHDKIEVNKFFVKQNIYYELVEKSKNIDKTKIINLVAEDLFSSMIVKLDKSVKIVDKIIDSNKVGNDYQVRVVLIVEENIGETKSISDENVNNHREFTN